MESDAEVAASRRCADCPQLRLVGSAQIVQWTRLSRQRIQQIVERPDFPAPIASPLRARLWLESDVRAWLRLHHPTEDMPDDRT